MRKMFANPEVEVVEFDTMDVITTSRTCSDDYEGCNNDDCPGNFAPIECPRDWA
jgi:hypothetical protein